MKFILFVFIFVSFCALCHGMNDRAINGKSNEHSGECGDNITWTFYGENHSLIISGEGNMTTFANVISCPWDHLRSEIRSVVIEEGVSILSRYSFTRCTNLVSVEFPSTVISMGSTCFSQCSSLVNITLPPNLTSIGRLMFNECSSLRSVLIPPSVKSISVNAFKSCSSLTHVKIPANVETIVESAFSNCGNLISFEVDTNNANFSSEDGILFNKEKTTLIQYPCGRSGHYTIPENVTSLAKNAFSHCSRLTSVNISSTVERIGDETFSFCGNLDSINVDERNEIFKSVDGTLLNKEGSSFIQFPGGRAGSFSVPETVSMIQAYSFSGCPRLTSVTIPSNTEFIYDEAFIECKSLVSVHYKGTLEPRFSTQAFFTCDLLDFICVPPNYNSSKFCGRSDFCNSSSCEKLIAENNLCFRVLNCGEGDKYIQKRSNASEWESHTNNCVEYICDNETGNTLRGKCQNKWMCVGNKCVIDDQTNNNDYKVEIEIDNITVEDSTPEEIKSQISIKCGIDIDKITIGIDMDESGRITRIVVFVKDDKIAQTIMSVVNSCLNVSGNFAANTHCDGVLKNVRSVKITGKNSLLSVSSRICVMMPLTIMLLSIFAVILG